MRKDRMASRASMARKAMDREDMVYMAMGRVTMILMTR